MFKNTIAFSLITIVLLLSKEALASACEICGKATHSTENCPELSYSFNQQSSHESDDETLSSSLGVFGSFSSNAVIVTSGNVQYDISSLLASRKHNPFVTTLTKNSMLVARFEQKKNDKHQWEYFQAISKSLNTSTPEWRKLWETACLYALSRVTENYHNYVNLAQSLVFLGYYDSALDVLAQAEFIAWYQNDEGFTRAIERWKTIATDQRKY